MTADFKKAQDEWKKKPKDEKIPLIIAAVILLSVFFPWFGSWGFSINGFHSWGILTFLGSLGYVLWKILPSAGVKLPDFGIEDAMLEKILAGATLAGTAFWMFSSNFAFGSYRFGYYIALVLSALLTYLVFSGKKFSEVQKMIKEKTKKHEGHEKKEEEKKEEEEK